MPSIYYLKNSPLNQNGIKINDLIILFRVEASWISEVESKPSSKYVNPDSLKVGEFILFSLQSGAI